MSLLPKPAANGAEDPMAALNPGSNEALMQMAKGNLMSYIPQTVIMAWVNYFFAGFVVMKLPFPLTDGFKNMLQSGVNTPDLNVRYVSSISWYFVNLFGLKPIYSLLMGSDEAAELMQQQGQQQPQMPNLVVLVLHKLIRFSKEKPKTFKFYPIRVFLMVLSIGS